MNIWDAVVAGTTGSKEKQGGEAPLVHGGSALFRRRACACARGGRRLRLLLYLIAPPERRTARLVGGAIRGAARGAATALLRLKAAHEPSARVPADGSDGVSKHEFEIFFRLMDMKKKSKSDSGAAEARRRILAPVAGAHRCKLSSMLLTQTCHLSHCLSMR